MWHSTVPWSPVPSSPSVLPPLLQVHTHSLLSVCSQSPTPDVGMHLPYPPTILLHRQEQSLPLTSQSFLRNILQGCWSSLQGATEAQAFTQRVDRSALCGRERSRWDIYSYTVSSLNNLPGCQDPSLTDGEGTDSYPRTPHSAPCTRSIFVALGFYANNCF